VVHSGGVLETPGRLLRLLGLFQARPAWRAPELAERLGVTERTVRRDVTRLRELGYPVEARPGAAGGYRFGSGAAMPPLLLDDDEVVAVAVGLRSAADGTVAGLDEAAERALGKLERVMPVRLRPRLAGVGSRRSRSVPAAPRSSRRRCHSSGRRAPCTSGSALHT
jgi:predicted DNA-binding transcriptional regulator YafY